MKIVLNKCFGGFCLSKEAYDFLGLEWDDYGFDYSSYDKRTDPELIKCVQTLGKKANGRHASLKVITIPDNIKYEIESYDGVETAYEIGHRW